MAENDNKELLKQLMNLSHLDIDAVHAYTSAIDRIELPEVKARLTEFRGDHERHIADLAPLIEGMGGTPPKMTPDFKGYLIQGFTAMKSMIGSESAIKAMKSNEELTNRTYEKALQFSFPANVMAVIQRNREDERRHLDYVNQCINERVWERISKKSA